METVETLVFYFSVGLFPLLIVLLILSYLIIKILPHSKLTRWIKDNIITDEDLESYD
jgi:sorbitol-specific phosphotransferase system component IIC